MVSRLKTPESHLLFEYVTRNYSKTYLPNLDILTYVDTMLDSVEGENPTLTYSYDGREYQVDFEGYYGKTISLPSSRVSEFEVDKVTSDVMVIATYNAFGIRENQVDSDLSLTRKYMDYETGEEKWNFKQGDIVKVVIDWEVDDVAIDDAYEVTDYAPHLDWCQ